MTHREEFEEFFVKEFSGEFTVSKKTMLLYDENTDQYMNGFVNDSYKTWQAAKAQAVPQWIPVSERLPELDGGPYVSKPVLAFDKYDDVVFAKYVARGYWVILYIDERREHGEITHWMPLPSVPEQNK